MTREEWKTKRLEDVGTRYQFYSDLISLWEENIELMTTYSYMGKHDQSKLDSLNASIELLRNTLDGMTEYHDQLLSLRRLVDYIPTLPEDIKGGRGTPLSPEVWRDIG